MGANFSSVVSQPGQRRRAIENNNKECKPMRSICIAISLVALLSSFGPSRAAIMQPWLLGRDIKRIWRTGMRLQVIPTVYG